MKKTTTPVTYGHTTKKSIRVQHFFNTAMKTFSLYDNVRSIPRLVDGLKPSQRKALCGTLSRGENASELQLERLASLIAAKTDYHHGAVSLVSTIVGMANDKMPGMNNMNLFIPSGQFGSRLTKEAGAGRYIFTQLSPYFRELFKKEDDCILTPIIVDGEEIEPHNYIPLLPMPLVNGASGTGTGHACEIFSYHPVHLRDAIISILNHKPTKAKPKALVDGTLTPWFRGYHGTVSKNKETGQVSFTGKLEIVDSTTIRITELSLGVYLDPYKEVLNKLEESGLVKTYDDNSSEDTFDFVLTVPRSTTAMPMSELLTKFKLVGRGTENFTVWNVGGTLEKFKSAEALLEAFVPWRLDQYEVRRQKLIDLTAEQIRFMSEKLRFVLFYLKNVSDFKSKKKPELIDLLLKNNFVDYDRLLSMSIWHLTFDMIEKLKKEIGETEVYLKSLKSDTADAMYARELKAFQYKG
jgi:DNA topoisomerase-2